MSVRREASTGNQLLTDLRSAGELTDEVFALVVQTARAIARLGGFESPTGDRRWSDDDVDDLVGDFVNDPGRVFDLAVRATDDDHLRRSIQVGLKRQILNRLRATEEGVLRRRIDRRVHNRDDIVVVLPEHWALTPYANEPHFGGGEALLATALLRIEIGPPPTWNSDKRPPATDAASLDSACTCVLVTAEAPVERHVVHQVICDRVLREAQASTMKPDDDDVPWEERVPDEGQPAVDAVVVAREIWESLSDDERALLPELATPARQLACEDLLNLKKSALDSRQQRLATKMSEMLFELDGASDIVAALHAISAEALEAAGHIQGDKP